MNQSLPSCCFPESSCFSTVLLYCVLMWISFQYILLIVCWVFLLHRFMSFIIFGEFSIIDFFKYSFCSFLSSSCSSRIMVDLMVFHRSLWLLFFHYIFFLILRLDNFNCPIFKYWSFFCLLKYIPYSEILISAIVHFR